MAPSVARAFQMRSGLRPTPVSTSVHPSASSSSKTEIQFENLTASTRYTPNATRSGAAIQALLFRLVVMAVRVPLLLPVASILVAERL